MLNGRCPRAAEGEILKLNPSHGGGSASGGGGGFDDFQPDAFLADKHLRDFGRAEYALRPGRSTRRTTWMATLGCRGSEEKIKYSSGKEVLSPREGKVGQFDKGPAACNPDAPNISTTRARTNLTRPMNRRRC